MKSAIFSQLDRRIAMMIGLQVSSQMPLGGRPGTDGHIHGGDMHRTPRAALCCTAISFRFQPFHDNLCTDESLYVGLEPALTISSLNFGFKRRSQAGSCSWG